MTLLAYVLFSVSINGNEPLHETKEAYVIQQHVVIDR